MATKMYLLSGDDQGLALMRSDLPGESWTAPECVIEGVEVAAIADREDGTVYVGTRGDGLFQSCGDLRIWERVEAPVGLRKVRSICTAAGRLLVGSEPAGVYERVDGGDWIGVGDVAATAGSSEWFYPVPTEEVHVRHLALDPHRPGSIYAAIQVGGVAITRDNGRTWTDRRNLDLDVHMVEPDPTERDRIYAGSGGGGLYESTDAGDTWTCISGGCGNFVVQFAIAHSEPERIYLGTARGHPPLWVKAGGAAGEMFRSDDRGRSWSRLLGGLPDPLESRVNTVAVDPSDPDAVFFGGGLSYKGARAQDGGVYGSRDGGKSWKKLLAAHETLVVWCGRR